MATPRMILEAARKAGDDSVVGAKDGYPCGFAWVIIKPARGPFVKFLKDSGIGSKGDFGGYRISSYEVSSFRGQNMIVKEDACRAFVKVLRDNNINAQMESRID